ncbi:MAG: type II secretion system secretin GspD [Candidatus Thiodiazotropha sp. (ex Lucinoma aequizonata)]|nr:type II secretion system secretin GspD [Candidatus Thiodiazotropha sp. (ex Lucinoma aequizonata)]MCU7887816.1 type II secretion system secretin GspD [Candidatus Thiodiazotropha sp. (ex Lucinoma aequizonata)]MCU7895549.1 type II secretion system secretin GspD [Candidatus Thiodiazotropha sp. (ex Lucinoma aequizonata)]MCU7899064.1 type II secretion system secretin GspD [Candidatus Thiodiazotropha sp. (ex Lucinoma aequizonata)]MCU7903258.1 type II secretion system secretin GspD [Candidatus Thiod
MRLRYISRLASMLCTAILLNLTWTLRSYAEQISLNLNNADIEILIETVADLTGKHFVIDPRVKGKVTVISAHPMESDEFYQVFLSILEVYGFSTIPSGDVIKIVPDVKAKWGGILTMDPIAQLPGDRIVTRIIQVKNITSAQLVPILRPLISREAHLAAYQDTNVLIISDRRQNVNRLMKIIKQIDQVSNNSIEVITLQHASAAEVVRILDGLQTRTAKGRKIATKLVADKRTNSILISGDPTARLHSRVVIQHLDTPFDNEGNAQVIYLKYANAADLVTILTGVSEDLDGTEQALGTATRGKSKLPINIQADEASNALIITAPPDIFLSLQAIIRKLDIRRAQVLVEAIIAEITYEKAKRFGVQWIIDATLGERGPVSVINMGSPNITQLSGEVVSGQKAMPLGPGASIGLGRFNSNRINFAALIQAMENDTATNILSTPSLTTLDNQEAEIVIGQSVPFITGSYSSRGAFGTSLSPFQTVQRENVGLTLKVKPQINEGNSIKLEIDQEVSSVNRTASANATDLITNKRTIKTVVMVDDGSTIVLGGLIQEDLQQIQEKVPILGDIPLLGALFRSSDTTKVKRMLVVFLRPTVIRDAAVNTQIAGEKYNYFRALQLEMKQEGINLMPDEETPVLPPLFDTLPPPFDYIELEPGQ